MLAITLLACSMSAQQTRDSELFLSNLEPGAWLHVAARGSVSENPLSRKPAEQSVGLPAGRVAAACSVQGAAVSVAMAVCCNMLPTDLGATFTSGSLPPKGTPLKFSPSLAAIWKGAVRPLQIFAGPPFDTGCGC